MDAKNYEFTSFSLVRIYMCKIDKSINEEAIF